jgi:hypothetical protein
VIALGLGSTAGTIQDDIHEAQKDAAAATDAAAAPAPAAADGALHFPSAIDLH